MVGGGFRYSLESPGPFMHQKGKPMGPKLQSPQSKSKGNGNVCKQYMTKGMSKYLYTLVWFINVP